MANILGTWKIVAVKRMDENCNPYWLDVEEYKNSPNYDNDPFMNSKLVFEEGGINYIITDIPEDVPQEEIDKAVAAGKVQIYGERSLIMRSETWKEEDGKIMKSLGVVRNGMTGEAKEEWYELKLNEDGTLDIMGFRYAKID